MAIGRGGVIIHRILHAIVDISVRVLLAFEGLPVVIGAPLVLHGRISGSPRGIRPEHGHPFALHDVHDEEDKADHRNLEGDEEGQEPADRMGPLWIVKDPLLVAAGAVDRRGPEPAGDAEDDREDDGGDGPADAPVVACRAVEHEFEIVWEAGDAVDPHEDGGLEDGHPEDAEAAAVGVHQVEDELAGVRDARDTGKGIYW